MRALPAMQKLELKCGGNSRVNEFIAIEQARRRRMPRLLDQGYRLARDRKIIHDLNHAAILTSDGFSISALQAGPDGAIQVHHAIHSLNIPCARVYKFSILREPRLHIRRD
ncbi:MAG TPA: hypothetical protein VGD63_05650 [Steroidobacteraceae bacterium]